MSAGIEWSNKALHWTGIPLRSIPASELERWAVIMLADLRRSELTMKSDTKGLLAFTLLLLMVSTPLAVIAVFVISLKHPFPNQEHVPLAIRVIALLAFLYFQQQFWRLVSRVILLVEAIQEAKLRWPGPSTDGSSGLYRRFVFRTAIMLGPLYLLFSFINPRFLVTGPADHKTLWFMLLVSAVAVAVMFSRAADDMFKVDRHLGSVGLK